MTHRNYNRRLLYLSRLVLVLKSAICLADTDKTVMIVK